MVRAQADDLLDDVGLSDRGVQHDQLSSILVDRSFL